MALPLSMQFPVVSFSPSSKTSSYSLQTRPMLFSEQSETLNLNISTQRRRRRRSRRNLTIISAIEEGRKENESQNITTEPFPASSSSCGGGGGGGGDGDEPESATQSGEVSELGMEIKKAMEERKKKELETGGDFWSGVANEVREIEWPAFGKVLGITGVVLGVIAGSSVVLLTVNAVLAELSDQVFAGKGVQDFFG